jgi:hypothetical protein
MSTKISIIILSFLTFLSGECYSQGDNDSLTIEKPILKESEEWERPFNFFAAAGASLMFGDHYDVTVSPIDNSVQFETTFPIITRFSLGLVWNPIAEKDEDYILAFLDKRKIYPTIKAARKHLAVALLVNVFQLSYSNDFNSGSPIDVGFGIGYRSSNFLILGTLELTPLRTPRTYFIDQFKDKDVPLILSGSTEPVRSISIDDNAIFVNRVFPSIGVKIAYSFTKQKQID